MEGIIVTERKYINQVDAQVTISFQLASHDWLKLEKSAEWHQVEEMRKRLSRCRKKKKHCKKQERTLKLQKDIVRCSIICLTIFLEKAFQRSSLVENIIL